MDGLRSSIWINWEWENLQLKEEIASITDLGMEFTIIRANILSSCYRTTTVPASLPMMWFLTEKSKARTASPLFLDLFSWWRLMVTIKCVR